MLRIADRIDDLAWLGDDIGLALDKMERGEKTNYVEVIRKAGQENPWFTEESVISVLRALSGWLKKDVLQAWASTYHLSEPAQVKTVAVIMAGNIPLVNFHDFLAVTMTGNNLLGKLSSQDKVLLPFLVSRMIERNPDWDKKIVLTENKLVDFDAVIATGSNNTSRYFDYYFGKYPHIIRKNRNSVGVLEGMETAEELRLLYQDIFRYYGLGCRNVSMLLVPKGYAIPSLLDQWEGLPEPTEHNKYKNNYDYYRSLYLLNKQPFFDTGYVSVLANESLATPVSVIHYVEYESINQAQDFIRTRNQQIQCLVSNSPEKWKDLGPESVKTGDSQNPAIDQYPDNTDIIQFLLAL